MRGPSGNLLLDSLRDLWEGFIVRLPSIITGLLVIVIFYALARGVRYLAARSLRRVKASEHAARLSARISFVCVMVLGALVALGVMGIDAGALVASLGLVSVGIGFALKDAIDNFIAGIILIFQRPFVVGDAVCFGSVEGRVEDVRVRDTVIRTFDGRQVFVPNSGIFTAAVINNSRSRRRRIDFTLEMAYAGDVSAAMDAAASAVREVGEVLRDPSPLVVVDALADGAVALKVFFWVDPMATDLLRARSDALRAVKRALEEAGVEPPRRALAVRPCED